MRVLRRRGGGPRVVWKGGVSTLRGASALAWRVGVEVLVVVVVLVVLVLVVVVVVVVVVLVLVVVVGCCVVVVGPQRFCARR